MSAPTPERRLRSRRQSDLERERLFALALDVLCVCGLDGVFRQVSPAAERILGWPAEEFLRRPFVDFVIEEDRAATLRQFDDVLRGGLAVHFENRWRHQDGTVRRLQWNALRDPQGTVIYATARDVTERRRAATELMRLATVVESSDDAIIGVALDGTIETWNRGAERLFGWGAGEVVGGPAAVLIPAGHADHLPQVLDQLRRGQHVTHYESLRRRKDGTVVYVSLSVSGVRGPDGDLLGAWMILRDVTERRQAEAERLSLLEQLRAALARAKRMSGTVHVCEVCHRVRDESGHWTEVFRYIDDHTDATPIPARCPDHVEPEPA